MKVEKGVTRKVAMDKELAVRIRNALQHDERLSADAVEVIVLDRVATLSGSVQSHRRKMAAVDAAESIHGCRGIIDNIVVSPAGVMRDDDIAANVRKALDSHADVTREVITVSVGAGVVTLQGNVASRWERDLAGDVAFGARGVRDVKNLLLVDLGNKIEDEALTTTIQDAIAHTRGLHDCGIRVAVNANTAVLSGEVKELQQRRHAEAVAARFRVTDIRNEIRIDGGSR